MSSLLLPLQVSNYIWTKHRTINLTNKQCYEREELYKSSHVHEYLNPTQFSEISSKMQKARDTEAFQMLTHCLIFGFALVGDL